MTSFLKDNISDAFLLLNGISGIGPITAKNLLSAFKGNPCAIFEASERELITIPGVGKKIISTPSKDYGINIATSTNVPNTKLYDAVIPAVTTKVGIAPTPLVAVKLLQNLASIPENIPGISYFQRKLIKVATSVDVSNEQISHILFKDVLSKVT